MSRKPTVTQPDIFSCPDQSTSTLKVVQWAIQRFLFQLLGASIVRKPVQWRETALSSNNESAMTMCLLLNNNKDELIIFWAR
jgi:hypothetical protein